MSNKPRTLYYFQTFWILFWMPFNKRHQSQVIKWLCTINGLKLGITRPKTTQLRIENHLYIWLILENSPRQVPTLYSSSPWRRVIGEYWSTKCRDHDKNWRLYTPSHHGWIAGLVICPSLRSCLEFRALDDQTCLSRLKIRIVWYSDPDRI